MPSDPIIAVDLSGTDSRTPLCTPDGAIRERERTATSARDGREAAIKRICQAVALASAEVAIA